MVYWKIIKCKKCRNGSLYYNILYNNVCRYGILGNGWYGNIFIYFIMVIIYEVNKKIRDFYLSILK